MKYAILPLLSILLACNTGSHSAGDGASAEVKLDPPPPALDRATLQKRIADFEANQRVEQNVVMSSLGQNRGSAKEERRRNPRRFNEAVEAFREGYEIATRSPARGERYMGMLVMGMGHKDGPYQGLAMFLSTTLLNMG